MREAPPELVAINHDDHHAKHVGHTADGRQFFLTQPFVPATSSEGREFLALYLFDLEGNLLDARIDDLGTRPTVDEEQAAQLHRQRLEELGGATYDRIEVKPFQVERFDTVFGLIPCELEDEEDGWTVTIEPGDYMAFFEPFDSGDYDT